MFRRYPWRTLLMIGGMVVLGVLSLVYDRIDLSLLGLRLQREGMVLGLDLRGGTHLVYEAAGENVTSSQMEGVVTIIERRVNAFGVAEPDIRLLGNRRVLVQLPGVTDVEQAKQLIGQTASLEFKDRDCPSPAEDPAGVCLTYTDKETGLTGAHLAAASPNRNPTTGVPIVSLLFNQEGTRLFAEMTTRLAGTEDRIAIFLDNREILAPVVRQPILNGSSFIEGPDFTIDRVQTLAIQLESGRLPIPIEVIQERDVDATLGAESLQKSLVAGVVGLALVALFMGLYYRLPGLVAVLALGVYTVIVLAIFKLAPITLTLSGIAAFILSVGMAVDANILIFERMKEELHAGRSLRAALDAGFDRAWSSIRDSNISTLITCVILWWFGDRLGISVVVGFALTLAIGVAISMFSAITVSRTLLRTVVQTPLSHFLGLFVPVELRAPPGRVVVEPHSRL